MLEKLVHHNRKPIPVAKTKEFFFPRQSTYYYKIPPIVDPGIYFVEILALFCTTFDPNSFKDICLEEVQDGLNVVNLPFSLNLQASGSHAHTILEPSTRKDAVSSRWVLSEPSFNDTSTNVKMLPTRYQKRNCDRNQYCEPTSQEVAQHNLYTWVGAPDWTVAWKQLMSHYGAGNVSKGMRFYTTVCFVGDSHARELSSHLPITKNDLIVPVFIQAKYPHTFDPATLKQHQCTYAVIAFGQWLVSYSEDEPYTAKRYESSMREMMQLVSPPAFTGLSKVYFCSINYNALGAYITSCPPFDHRSPPVIDMLNEVLIIASAKNVILILST
jgi:hypothetical protein